MWGGAGCARGRGSKGVRCARRGWAGGGGREGAGLAGGERGGGDRGKKVVGVGEKGERNKEIITNIFVIKILTRIRFKLKVITNFK